MKPLPTYDDFLLESYATMLKSTAQIMLSDPKIRSAARNLIDEIIGKGIDYAMNAADNKIGIQSRETSSIEDFDNDSRIETEEDSIDFVSSYIATQIAKKEEERIPEKTLSSIFSDIKTYIKNKIS